MVDADIRVPCRGNGSSVKEGVCHTYANVNGYCPLAAYLGSHGSCSEFTLRTGLHHAAREIDFNPLRSIPMAQRLSAVGPGAPILAWLHSRFDSVRLVGKIETSNRLGVPQVDRLNKWNPRETDVAATAARLGAEATKHRLSSAFWRRPGIASVLTIHTLPTGKKDFILLGGSDHAVATLPVLSLDQPDIKVRDT